ncbi:glycoside hydrolase family 16 protein [Pseudonocardia charpentierae]|uniref:Glycoside hydrolase family 16 protein n=1 Tax=Pseudonocardia charpentierae TaxID=3075545 RepID=A0ABU2NBC9_9PSEU|nr:glycoside hydrolase family 16 protein [Pseudonocardia sp. DSM 45834]MDT0351262.1 glycoside hydrolase family 16 protein [Pseudonocardia sp. DSM 45834]
MLGDNLDSAGWPTAGEIDVMENVGKVPGSVYGTLHGPGAVYENQQVTAEYTLPEGQAFADDFHTFAVEWSPTAITWYVDGQPYEKRTKEELASALTMNVRLVGDTPCSVPGFDCC